MFEGFTTETAQFMWDLKFNNERAWFMEHKDVFERTLNAPFKALAADTMGIIAGRYPYHEMIPHVSRIYRDARRLYGRGPYKESLWFSFRTGRTEEADVSFFFEIFAEGWSCGMGFFCPKSYQVEQFRKAIDANPAAFEHIAGAISDCGLFSIQGPVYKKIHGTHSDAANEWYNRRNAYAVHGGNFDGILLSSELPAYLADTFGHLMPMFDFIEDCFAATAARSGNL